MNAQISRILAVILFLFFAWSGIIGWWNQWNHCNNLYEEMQTMAQLLFGLLSLPIVGYLVFGRPLPKLVERSFTLFFVIAGGMAPVVWGRQGVLIGIAAGALTILMALGALWLARRGSRAPAIRSI
jgi:hypothetical protein